VVAANRDEFYGRPSLPAAFWPVASPDTPKDASGNDQPYLFAGQDLVHGGTWMGITLSGRFAAVTNYRQKTDGGAEHRSRGIMVRDFLTGEMSPLQYATDLLTERDSYGGFNLLLKDASSFWYCSNRSPDPLPIQQGVHGLSNHLLDTQWLKVKMGKEGLRQLLEKGLEVDPGLLFHVLKDRTVASDGQLPDTGYGIELERMLSSTFIVSPEYGTRSSTVMLVGNDGNVTFVERNFSGPDDPGEESRHTFSLSLTAET
jgi:uncharacterized protein with NRDE domain